MENVLFMGNGEHGNDGDVEWHRMSGAVAAGPAAEPALGARGMMRVSREGGDDDDQCCVLSGTGREGNCDDEGFGSDAAIRNRLLEERGEVEVELITEEEEEEEEEEETRSAEGDIDDDPPPYRLISEEARREILRGSLSMVGNDLAQIPFGEGMMERMEEERLKVGLDRDGKRRAPLLSVVIQAPDGALFIGKETPLPCSRTSTVGLGSSKQPLELLQQQQDGAPRTGDLSTDMAAMDDGTCFDEFSEFAPVSRGRAPGLSATHIVMPMRMQGGTIEDDTATTFSRRYHRVILADYETATNPFQSDSYLRRKRSFMCLLVVDAILYMLMFLVNVIQDQYRESGPGEPGYSPHVFYMQLPAATADLLLSLFLDALGICGAIQDSGSILTVYITVECIVTFILALSEIKPYLVFRVIIILLALQLRAYILQIKNLLNQGDHAQANLGQNPRQWGVFSFLTSPIRRLRQCLLQQGQGMRSSNDFTPVAQHLPPPPPPASPPDEGSTYVLGRVASASRTTQVDRFEGVVVDIRHSEVMMERDGQGDASSSMDSLSQSLRSQINHTTRQSPERTSQNGVRNDGVYGGVESESVEDTAAPRDGGGVDPERRGACSTTLSDQAWAYQRAFVSGGQPHARRSRRHSRDGGGSCVCAEVACPDGNVPGEGNGPQVFLPEDTMGDGSQECPQVIDLDCRVTR